MHSEPWSASTPVASSVPGCCASSPTRRRTRVRSDRRQDQLRDRQIALGAEPSVSDDGGASDTVVAAERREAVAAALARLPVADRVVIAYRWFEDMTERDIATALGVRPGTVKSRLSRAMARLRAELERSEVTVD